MSKKVIGTFIFLLTATYLFSQNINTVIKGQIVDVSGNPIIGATVKSLKSNTFAISNINGFSIKINKLPDSLIINCVGYQKGKYIIRKKEDIKIVLSQKISALNDITINTGYQTIPKERSTGSFTIIDNNTLNRQAGTNIINRLKGVTSGLLFDDSKLKEKGKNTNFNVHGLSSINGTNDPLIVLDNFPYDGDINSINPDDIESVSILKDAAAASIWGARAGNGVIIITTKSGKLNQPLRMSARATTTYTEKPDLFSLNRMSTREYIEAEEYLYDKGYFDVILNGLDYQPITQVVEILHKKDIGELTADDADTRLKKLKTYDIRDQLNKYVYRNAINQQYAINLNGGSKKDAYNVSFSFDKNITELNAKLRRFTGSIKNTFKPFSFLSVNTGLTYSDIRTTPGRPGINSYSVALRKVPYMRLVDDEGMAVPADTYYRTSYTDTVGEGRLLNWKYYPLTDFNHTHNNNSQNNLVMNFGVELKIIKGLDFDFKYQYFWQALNNDILNDLESFYTRDLINKYTQIDPITKEVTHNLPIGSILNKSNTKIISKNMRGQLNYEKTIKNFDIIALMGSELRKSSNDYYGYTTYGYNENNKTAVAVDELQKFPSYLGNETLSLGNSNNFSGKHNNFISYFGNTAITYLNKYTLSGSFRKDASNLFGVNTNDKWNPFWSSGLSWNISNETFFNVSWIDYLKFRSTLGFSGNVDQSMSAVTVIKYSSGNGPSNQPFATVSQDANPDLGWETVKTINFGLDFSIVKNKIHGSIDVYKKFGSDLIGPYYTDPTMGLHLQSINKNVANMKGKGFDLTLGFSILNTALKWNANLLLNYYADKVTKYNFTLQRASDYIGRNYSISAIVGMPIYSVGGYMWGGLDHETGSPMGYLNRKLSMAYDSIVNQPGENGVKYFGSSSPKYFGSISNSFEWKGFFLDFNIQYRFGYYFRKDIVDYKQLVAGNVTTKDYSNRWIKPGDEEFTNIPSFIYPVNNAAINFYYNSEINIGNADHIRFQFLNFGYKFNSAGKQTPFKNIKVSLNINNIGLLWTANKWGVDPEYQGSIAPPRSYSLSFKTNF